MEVIMTQEIIERIARECALETIDVVGDARDSDGRPLLSIGAEPQMGDYDALRDALERTSTWDEKVEFVKAFQSVIEEEL
jgi:hypothetical protein